MVSRPRQDVRFQAAKCFQVFEEGRFVGGNVFAQARVFLTNAFDDFILHVGDVHDMVDLETAELKITPHEIGENESAEISDMAEVVNSGTAAIQSRVFPRGIQGHKRFERTRERIVEFQSHAAGGAYSPMLMISSSFSPAGSLSLTLGRRAL